MNIRNLCVLAHIDHGKSTLCDRFLEICGAVPKDKMKPQLLDSLALERERGITIKLAPVRLQYILNSELYILNLIDTPGHVDFSYEVSRSLSAVEGAILLVDATQGVQAQTLSHGLAALEQNLILIPVVNKIDLPNADITKTKKELKDSFGFNEEEILLASSKTGEGVEEILHAVVERIPPPSLSTTNYLLRALIFDSFFDSFKGVVAEVRISDGRISDIGTKIKFLGTKAEGQVLEMGVFTPQTKQVESLSAGEIGYIATGIKEPELVRVGDTIATENIPPLPGYKQVKPMVFVGLYPIDPEDSTSVKEALSKFKLNDPAFSFEAEQSQALGSGFRCGFLGLLHSEVVQERLRSEYGVDLIATTPSVEYTVDKKIVDNPADFDEMAKIIKEPWVNLKIFTPQNFVGNVMELVQDKRGKLQDMQYFGTQVELKFEIPLAEMITDFYDKLKSISSGFASLDYRILEFREVKAVRVDILVAGERVDALSQIVVQKKSESVGRRMVEKLKEVLPRQNFAVAIQAAIGGKIIARETLPAFRKDVTAKLYGGDRTRKDKLLEKQKKGKKKMKMIGRVEIPQEAFLSILKT